MTNTSSSGNIANLFIIKAYTDTRLHLSQLMAETKSFYKLYRAITYYICMSLTHDRRTVISVRFRVTRNTIWY